jgi:hypothetical protein
MAILIAFWIDDLWAGRIGRTGLVAFAGVAIVLLVMRDLVGEEKQLIELFVYRYDRPWPSMPPWKIDVSDGFLGFGVAFAVAVALVGFKATRRWSIFALGAAAAGFAAWAMYVYMPIAATHWGMREAAQTYYQKRDVHGLDITYYKLGQIAEEWEPWLAKPDGRDYEVRSVLPETIALEQEKVIRVSLAAADGKTMDRTVEMHGPVVRLGDDAFTVHLSRDEVAKLAPLVREGHGLPSGNKPPWLAVDADRLIAWQLYWRGENFWSADEVWGRTDDRRTAFKQTDNVEFLKYLNTPGRVGQRFFVLTESGRATSLKGILPTARAKETFEILDTTSNKFSLLSFVL